MGATPGSGIGMPADPATDAGSNLVFICAVLIGFVAFSSSFTSMRDKFICKGCSSTLGFATSFDVDEVVGIFILRSDKLSDE